MADVAQAFKMKAMDIQDDPEEIRSALVGVFDGPMLLNINTHRKFWHSGAGIDDENTFDRYKVEMNSLGQEAVKIDEEVRKEVHRIWEKMLEIQ